MGTLAAPVAGGVARIEEAVEVLAQVAGAERGSRNCCACRASVDVAADLREEDEDAGSRSVGAVVARTGGSSALEAQGEEQSSISQAH